MKNQNVHLEEMEQKFQKNFYFIFFSIAVTTKQIKKT